MSHLIFASCYVRDTRCSRHFHFAFFFVSRNQREAKIPCDKVCTAPRVWFLGLFGLKTAIHFAHFCLESGIVFEGTTGVNGRSFHFNSK